jgi:hypothetical protein
MVAIWMLLACTDFLRVHRGSAGYRSDLGTAYEDLVVVVAGVVVQLLDRIRATLGPRQWATATQPQGDHEPKVGSPDHPARGRGGGLEVLSGIFSGNLTSVTCPKAI